MKAAISVSTSSDPGAVDPGLAVVALARLTGGIKLLAGDIDADPKTICSPGDGDGSAVGGGGATTEAMAIGPGAATGEGVVTAAVMASVGIVSLSEAGVAD